MRRITTLLLTLIAISVSAQERRLLTMEEAILSTELIPQRYSVMWDAAYPDCYIHREGKNLTAINIRNGKQQSATLSPKATSPAQLEGNNIVWVKIGRAHV